MGAKTGPLALAITIACTACTEAQPHQPEPLDLPDWEACVAGYGGDIHQVLDAVERGAPAAMLCELAVTAWREPDSRRFELLYRLYRLRGREPEGLDAMVRTMDRREVATRLGIIHRFSAELEAFEFGYWGCTAYDPVARELILRAEPGGDMECVPRRWVFWG
jgi:hypothetical protein